MVDFIGTLAFITVVILIAWFGILTPTFHRDEVNRIKTITCESACAPFAYERQQQACLCQTADKSWKLKGFLDCNEGTPVACILVDGKD